MLVLSISGEISAQEKRDSVRIYFHQEHSTTQTIYTCRILLIFLLIIPLLHYPFLYNIANKAF